MLDQRNPKCLFSDNTKLQDVANMCCNVDLIIEPKALSP